MKATFLFAACLACASIASAECKVVANGKQAACDQQQEKALVDQLNWGIAALDPQGLDTSNFSRLQSSDRPVLGKNIADTPAFSQSAKDLQAQMTAMSDAVRGPDAGR